MVINNKGGNRTIAMNKYLICRFCHSNWLSIDKRIKALSVHPNEVVIVEKKPLLAQSYFDQCNGPDDPGSDHYANKPVNDTDK